MSTWIFIAIFVGTAVGLIVLFVFFVGVYAIIDAYKKDRRIKSETRTPYKCEMIRVSGGAGWPNEGTPCGKQALWDYCGTRTCAECACLLDADARAQIQPIDMPIGPTQ